MKRRDFLRVSAAGVAASAMGGAGLLSWTPRASAATINKTYYITAGYIEQPDGTDVYFRGFSNSSGSLNVPGESLIVQEGDTVNITVVNTLSTSHSFVIDGLVDSGTIRGGRSANLSFTANKVGSFLFYDKLNAPYNRLVGLHGGFAVMPQGSNNELYAGSPQFVQQYFWIFNDIDPVWHDRIRRGYTPSTQYIPRYFTLNGLSGRPPGAPGAHDPNIGSLTDPRSALHGHIGDRTLIRMFNVGKADQSVHAHANHMEWLTENGVIRPDVWKKDCLYLEGDMGSIDSIFPFETPPDAYPPVSTGAFPMHLHTEMSQTAAGGSYMFGAMTDIYFE
ncbi:multicopper oxidase domain-containing protein [Methylomarinum vadi]|uniref:multicopper oxidase domain-containing protein n=1 Tax=Methylomarinum vadi TaxID=438855 RepID=UPI0004DFBC76|nr:multicopper oxidase domain-containing protein [Methylomarinum vadi]